MFPNGPPSWYGSLIGGMTDASGYMYRRNRYLDPATGRFTEEDPIGLAAGLNLYGFAGADPVNYSDPFGLNPCLVPPVAPACLEAVAVGGAVVIAILLTKEMIDQTVGNSIPLANNWSTDRMPTGKIRKLWEELWGKKWPTEPSGRPYDADHDIPLADGGTDTPDNITPRTHDDHVQRHKDKGDFARWGRRGKKQEPKPQEPPQRPQDPQNPREGFLLL
jgi:RHS repeat-associated protein